jgi:hypothetical protein
MPFERQNMSDQEISIKEREHELFVKPASATASRPVKPFPVYLRETPAEPLSPTTKAILWIVAIIVAMLFLAALWKITHPRRTKPPTKNREPNANATTFVIPARPFIPLQDLEALRVFPVDRMLVIRQAMF